MSGLQAASDGQAGARGAGVVCAAGGGARGASDFDRGVSACAEGGGVFAFCVSALQFYGLGSEQPHEVWIALPEGAQTPALGYPPLRVACLRGAADIAGIETDM
jgi:predicted transcriptional regulator of viral defense system